MDESPVVLHVDGDPTARDATADALATALPAVDVRRADRVAEARERLTDDVDAAVFEYDLPDGTGLELLRTVRERDPDLPVVLFTGSGDESVASRAVSAGVTDYVTKGSPEAHDEVASAVADALRARPGSGGDGGGESERDVGRRDDATAFDEFPPTVQRLGDPVYRLDGEGYVRAVNEAFEETFGFDREAVVGEHLTEFVDRETYEAATERLLEAVADDETRHVTVELRTERADGADATIEAAATPLVEDGRLVGSVGTVRDVTERDRRERRLETYRELVETVSDPMFKLDVEGNIEMVNDAMAGFGGYDREELVGKHFTEFLDPDEAAESEDLVRQLLSDDGPDTAVHEFTAETKAGSQRVLEDSLTVLTDDDGMYAGTAGVLRDVTEREQRARELAQYETYIETVPVGMFAVDEDGVLTWTNGEAWKLLGVDEDLFRERYVGEPYLKLVQDGFFDTDHVEEYQDLVREMLSSDSDTRRAVHDVEVYRADGSVRYSDAHTALLPLDDGQFTGTVTAFRDITKQKEYERELERQNERLERFASVVSHDLRNPLTVAQGHLDAAKTAADPSEPLSEIEVSLERMRELIDDVLALARQGESVADPRPTDLASLIEEAWETAETESASLRVETTATVQADASRLRRLFENCFRNSVEHGGPDVTVTVGDLDDGFYVEDDGEGVPEDKRDQVFELGFTTASTGTGFGLGIVSEIVDAHGWVVELADGEAGGARLEFRGVQRVASV